MRKARAKFLDHAHLIKTMPIFIAGGTVAMGIVTINVVMVVIWCALIEVQDSKSMEEKADMIHTSLSKGGFARTPSNPPWIRLCDNNSILSLANMV